MLSAGRGGMRASVAAGVLAGLALLTKQTFVAALLAGSIWLWPDRGRVGAFAGSAALVVGIPCLWLQFTTGAFVENLASPLFPFDAAVADRLVRQFIVAQWLPLALAGSFLLFGPWRRRDARLLIIYWLASSLQLIGLAKIGSNHNYFIEFAAATAMLGALGVHSLLHASGRGLAVAAAAGLLAVFSVVLGGEFVRVASGGLGTIRTTLTEVNAELAMLRSGSRDADFDRLVDRVRNSPGIVLADPPDVVVLANRPVYFEPLIYSVLMAEGAWRPEAAVDTICSGQVRIVVLDYRLGDHSDTYGSRDAFPAPVLRALESVMRYETTQANRSVYTLRPDFKC